MPPIYAAQRVQALTRRLTALMVSVFAGRVLPSRAHEPAGLQPVGHGARPATRRCSAALLTRRLHWAQGLLTGKYFARGGASPLARLNLYRGRYAEAEGRYSFERHAQRHG